jgi:hypothetical protein
MADNPLGAPSSDAETPEARLWAAIRTWRDAHIAGGPIARATECWNHLEASLQSLTAAILKEI